MTDPMTREQIEALLASIDTPKGFSVSDVRAIAASHLALMDEVERLTSDRLFILGANHGYEEAMAQVAAEARRYASHYPEGSDGRNTFIIFAEWAERAALQEQKP